MNYLEKVAMYEDELIEKIATRAWKKHWGDLSERSQKTLVDRGVHNYDRYTEGIRKRTDAISKKHGTKFVTMKDLKGKMPSSGSLVMDRKIHKSLKKGGYFLLNDNKHNYVVNNNRSRSFKKMSKGMSKNERRQLHEILTGHEAFHELGNLHKMKPEKHYGSHVSPGVIHGESADVALAYPKVKKAMEKMRKDSSQSSVSNASYGDKNLIKNIGSMFGSQYADLGRAGIEYGKSPIVNKKIMRAHENAFFNEKPIRSATI